MPRASTFVSIESALVLVLVLCACSGGDGGAGGVTTGMTCSEVCSAGMACSQPADASCMSDCGRVRMVWNQAAWDAYTGCISAAGCQSLENCTQQAIAATPEAPVERFIGKICSWASRCASGALTQSQCVSMLRDAGEGDRDSGAKSPWDFVRLVQASAVDCVTNCIQGLSCTETDFGAASSSCTQKCGLGDSFGPNGQSSNEDSFSFDSSSAGGSCEAQHGNCGDHGQITQNQLGACECQCDTDYISSDYVCVPGCAMTGCSDHGSCGDSGLCNCDQGYYASPTGPDAGCVIRPYFVAFSTSARNTCAVRNDGALECWGDASDAVLKLPTPNSGFARVALGGSMAGTQACALRDDSSVACWTGIPAPGVALRSLSLGNDAACGVQSDGGLRCWGSSPFGINTAPELAGFKDVTVADELACGIRLDASLRCWGMSEAVARVPADLHNVAQVCAYSGSGCVRHDDGSVECFGTASYVGQAVPAPNSGFIDVSCGEFQVCALRADGSAACWGNDALLNGNLNPPAGTADFTDIDVGYEHSCGLRKDGSLTCWGSNTRGQAPPSRTAKL